MSQNLESYIKDAIIEMIASGIAIELHQRNSLADSFGEEDRVFCCSTVGDIGEWGPYFVHEFSHFKQWKEKKYSGGIYLEAIENFDLWLEEKRELSLSILTQAVNRIKRSELDCEKRVVKDIEKYSLEINLNRYIKKANAYILSHNMIIETRISMNAASEVEEIIEMMPTKFFARYDRVPDRYRKLYMEYCT